MTQPAVMRLYRLVFALGSQSFFCLFTRMHHGREHWMQWTLHPAIAMLGRAQLLRRGY